MTLSLYKRSKNKTEAIFNWAPTEKQWWITGFNPEFTNPNPKNMAMVCSIDFLNNDLYSAFKNESIRNQNKKGYGLLFDDEYNTVWLLW